MPAWRRVPFRLRRNVSCISGKMPADQLEERDQHTQEDFAEERARGALWRSSTNFAPSSDSLALPWALPRTTWIRKAVLLFPSSQGLRSWHSGPPARQRLLVVDRRRHLSREPGPRWEGRFLYCLLGKSRNSPRTPLTDPLTQRRTLVGSLYCFKSIVHSQ